VGCTGSWEEYVAAVMLGMGVDCLAIADVEVSERCSGVFHYVITVGRKARVIDPASLPDLSPARL
jgi:hypothetical protein